MSLTYGFYDSIGNDRVYDAEQFGSIFDGVINDGIYERIGNAFIVSIVSGMQIKVGSGRAWFNHTWTYNDGDEVLTLSQGSSIDDRTDTVCLTINKTYSRSNYLEILEGSPSSSASPATINNSDGSNIYRYPLAYIKVRKNATSLQASDITNARGTSATPFVVTPTREWHKGFLDSTNAELLNRLEAAKENNEAALQQYLDDFSAEYDAWRENIEDVFEGDGEHAAIRLQAEIDRINYQMENNKYGITEIVDEEDDNITADPVVINGRTYYFDLSDAVSYAIESEVTEVASDVAQLENSLSTTQSALTSEITRVENRFNDLFVLVRAKVVYDIEANRYISFSKDDFGIPSISGYTPIALATFSSGAASSVILGSFNMRAAQSTTGFIYLRNLTSTALTAKTCIIRVLYVKANIFAQELDLTT